jgi:hypothetical protein
MPFFLGFAGGSLRRRVSGIVTISPRGGAQEPTVSHEEARLSSNPEQRSPLRISSRTKSISAVYAAEAVEVIVPAQR